MRIGSGEQYAIKGDDAQDAITHHFPKHICRTKILPIHW